MSNQNVYWIAAILFAAFLLDFALNEAAASIFLALKLFDLIDFLMFWR